MELDLPWDQPVDEEDWDRVVEYCVNDVRATEAVFEDRKGDFVARQILAELSGLTVNDTTQRHTAKIVFGDDKNPQKKFVYTDLSKEFPGYVYDLESRRTGEKTQVKGVTSTRSRDAIATLPFWTWRVCIRPVLSISISSALTPTLSLLSRKHAWRSSVRTTREQCELLGRSTRSSFSANAEDDDSSVLMLLRTL